MMQGQIIEGRGGLYTVRDAAGIDHVLRAKKKFRRQHMTPLVGDRVDFTPGEGDEHGWLEEILPRSSQCLRPPVANIDLLLVTLAAAAPDPDLLLADRLLVRAQRAGIEACIVVNKTDLSENIVQEIRSQYEKSGYRVLTVCAREQIGLDELKALARGRIVAFAGQSAVGKSTLMNALCPGLGQETGEVSRIERGRHTTRKAQLFPTPGGGYLADTPGFSLLELDAQDPDTLKDSYPEFAPYEGQCRFLGCQHIGEPDCAVKQAAKEGLLSTERLERYALLHQEIKEKWGRRYD